MSYRTGTEYYVIRITRPRLIKTIQNNETELKLGPQRKRHDKNEKGKEGKEEEEKGKEGKEEEEKGKEREREREAESK